jgi:hypothetical protein
MPSSEPYRFGGRGGSPAGTGPEVELVLAGAAPQSDQAVSVITHTLSLRAKSSAARVGALPTVLPAADCRTAHDAGGEHHFIPLAWVDHVDSTVHLKQSGAEAKARWKTWSIADFESFSPAGRVL